MNHPNTSVGDGDSARRLKGEYRDRRRNQLVRLSVRSRASRVRIALLGSLLGVAAVVVLCALEKQPFAWYVPVWEALLLGGAGYLLARARGGFLNGLALFGVAYAACGFLRELGYDSGQVLRQTLEPRSVTLHGDFAALLALAVVGGLIGFTSDRR